MEMFISVYYNLDIIFNDCYSLWKVGFINGEGGRFI